MLSKINSCAGKNGGMNEKPSMPEDLSREQMWDMILQLRQEIADLKAQPGKPRKTSRNSSVPSSQTKKERGVHSRLSYLNGTHHIAQQRLADLMQAVFGLHISAGAIVNSLQHTARQLAAPAHDILRDIRRSAVIGSDETGLRVEGANWWLWVLQTPTASYFAAADTCARDVLDDALNESYHRVVAKLESS